MFAALSENREWFLSRVNVACLLAPVANVYRAGSPACQKIKNNETFVKVMKKMGPEMFPQPQGKGTIMSNFMSMSGLDQLGLM
jgi:hypothetical protein